VILALILILTPTYAVIAFFILVDVGANTATSVYSSKNKMGSLFTMMAVERMDIKN